MPCLFEYLGAVVRTYAPSDADVPIVSVAGFPPPAGPSMRAPEDVAGYVVATPCDASPADRYTELLIGLRRVGSEGGGWDGILVTYEADGRAYVLEIERGMYICGTAHNVCD
jgi:hypothetical protein